MYQHFSGADGPSSAAGIRDTSSSLAMKLVKAGK